jgi:hypothetical protein
MPTLGLIVYKGCWPCFQNLEAVYNIERVLIDFKHHLYPLDLVDHTTVVRDSLAWRRGKT